MKDLTTRFSSHVYDRNSSSNNIDSELSSWLSDARSSRHNMRDSTVLSSPSRSSQRSPVAAVPRSVAPPPPPLAPPVAQVIRYSWDRNYSQGLEFGRHVTTPAAARQALIPIYWRPGTDVLGITLDVEATTRQIIVTYSTRRDLRAGSILLRVASQRAYEENFHTLLLAAKAARGVTTCLEFAPPPPPVVVKKANYELALLGIAKDVSFELVAVDGCCVRYLSLQDINQRIHTASPTCEMVFERLAKQKAAANDSLHHGHHRKTRSASDDVLTTNRNSAVARGAGIATALSAVATIAGAMS